MTPTYSDNKKHTDSTPQLRPGARRDKTSALPIGFIRQSASMTAGKGAAEAKRIVAAPAGEILFQFDDGEAITFEQATRNVLVTGSTGCGKTKSAILPMIDNLIAGGHSGIIFDVKNTLTDDVRRIAAARGRLADIVEFGSEPTASSTNLLDAMKNYEIADLLSDMATVTENDPNLSWGLKGAKIASDVARVLAELSACNPKGEVGRGLRPNLKAIFEMINDQNLAWQFWGLYVYLVSRGAVGGTRERLKERRFVQQVNADQFHIFKDPSKPARDYAQQITWNLQHINAAFSRIERVPGLLDRFSDNSGRAVPMDFSRLLYEEGKIVIVRFNVLCGDAGDLLCRTIKNLFYNTILASQGKAREGRYTFMVGDEFQFFCDMSSGDLSDGTVFGLTREFRHINIVATQSLSSLLLKGGSEQTLKAFLGNCVTKIFLQQGDPFTMDWLRSFSGEAEDILTLGRGRCLYVTSSPESEFISTTGELNDAYGAMRELLTDTPLPATKGARSRSRRTGTRCGRAPSAPSGDENLWGLPARFTGVLMDLVDVPGLSGYNKCRYLEDMLMGRDPDEELLREEELASFDFGGSLFNESGEGGE